MANDSQTPAAEGSALPRFKGVTTFGRYNVLDRIAVGGMAEILLARSASLSGIARTCVIKRILPNYSSDIKFVNMFIDEARITIGLHHPNIVTLHEFGQHEGAYFMAMEYVDGTDLASVLDTLVARGAGLTPESAVYIALGICRGLDHAHNLADKSGQPLNIVHRDISPHNVLLGRRGEVKITDFGIAAAQNKLTSTIPGTVMGKSPYLSPEQGSGEKVDSRTDLWSVGVILHELLCGNRLFVADSLVATILQVINEPIVEPADLNPEIPAQLNRIVMKALQRPVEDRYQSAQEMASDLEAYLERSPYSAEDMAEYLAKLEWSGTTAPMRPNLLHKEKEIKSSDITLPFPHLRVDDPIINTLFFKLRSEPDLWTLIAMGDRYIERQEVDVAVSAYRTAAAVFAYRGLLIQAVCAYDLARKHLPPATQRKDLMALGELVPSQRDELEELLDKFDGHGFWPLLQLVDAPGLGSQARSENTHTSSTPLFGFLAPLEFAELAQAVRVRRLGPGVTVILEGERSASLFAVGCGRLVVHCVPGAQEEVIDMMSFPSGVEVTHIEVEDPTLQEEVQVEAPEKIYLGALADGDFFGEFSFLTQRPRSATVETITDCTLVEMKRSVVDSIFDRDPTTQEPLIQFYKERVVELLMAKSSLFSLLSPEDRHTLLQRSTLVPCCDQEMIVTEGEHNDSFYFIKSGEVEIFRYDGMDVPIFINKLRAGQFFGEIAALKQVPRTVNVRAMGEATLLRIRRADLMAILDREPRLRDLFEATIASRTEQIKHRIAEYQQVLWKI